MSNSVAFIKVCQNMPNHPKVADLSDRAFRDLITIWCYSAEHQTDGHLTARRYAALTTPESGQELLAEGLVEATEDGFQVHDYLKHQQSKAEIETLRAVRAEQGRKGGLRSGYVRRREANEANREANGQASAEQDLKQNRSKGGSKTQAEVEVEVEVEREVLRTSQDARTRAKTTPLPDDWQPTTSHATYATEHHLDLNSEAFKFRNHAIANDRRQVRWDATFTTWLAKAREYAPKMPLADTRKAGLPEGW